MEKTVNFYGNNKDFVIYKGRKYYYENYSGSISWYFDILKLLSDKNYYNETIISLEFNRFEIIYDYQYKRKKLFLPVSKELIEYYSTTKEFENSKTIRLTNIHINNNVNSFYEFSIEVIIDNFRTGFQRSFAFEDKIYIETPENEFLKSQMTQLFGEPENIPELDGEKYDSGKKFFFNIVSKSRIDKIIGVKKYRDTSTIGQPDGEKFTGIEEELVLDLNNFDENIYKIFEDHGMLEIQR
ncbi:Uncharacterised protein [Candidatus Ornithobacterium hominis]|uniref:Uncharacterized protein n=1 Tax=Candidatus Ornithobacterium hominis TaxID=2497989 RepID=A0A383U1C5_9FLAO|nr:hypothetical protein [Candidatus Ornithobacterium hominis]MCT7904365.1 hypothetical protein [Candidatus Ornithobacterium hominis]CAI9429328.1 DUF3108 domain-containing protein [Candidatus Ornithobacterium hominis]SZD73086.1 Uncharacterised protein [Candidatus Ornithobacterium hominis]